MIENLRRCVIQNSVNSLRIYLCKQLISTIYIYKQRLLSCFHWYCSFFNLNYHIPWIFWNNKYEFHCWFNAKSMHVFLHIYICITYFLYHICRVFMRFTFFCSCRIPYSKASAVGGHPETTFFTYFGQKSKIHVTLLHMVKCG